MYGRKSESMLGWVTYFVLVGFLLDYLFPLIQLYLGLDCPLVNH